MKQGKNYTFAYSLLPFFYWMGFAAVMSFTSYYLLAKGFSNTQIGMVVAIAGAISAILQPIIAGYADQPASPSLKKIELFLAAIMVLFACLLFITPNVNRLWIAGIQYAALIVLLQLQTPLINALGTESMNQNMKINYGLCRAIGSVGYALSAYLLGFLTSKMGADVIPLSIMMIYAALFLSLSLYPFRKEPKAVQEMGSKQTKGHPLSFFLKYKRITVFLIGAVFMYICHVSINNFMLQIMQSRGGESADMGLSQALASILEIPTLLVFAHLIKVCRVRFLVALSAGVFFLKTFATLLAPTVWAIHATQLLQILGWGLMVVACVYYINENMEPEDTIKGQAYMTMTYTIGTVIGSLLCGTLIDRFSVNTMLMVSSIAGFIGMVLIFLATNFSRVKQSEHA